MTEAEWLVCEDPHLMLFSLRSLSEDGVNARKARLFVCCRLQDASSALIDWRSRAALEVNERFADVLATVGELEEARSDASDAVEALAELFGVADERYKAALGVCWAAEPEREYYEYILCGLLASVGNCGRSFREIFGNPFRPVSVDPEWRTSDVLALGRGIYQERAFDRMPILADALQDARCDNDDILNHLRDATAMHVRGCWALDLVLGKE